MESTNVLLFQISIGLITLWIHGYYQECLVLFSCWFQQNWHWFYTFPRVSCTILLLHCYDCVVQIEEVIWRFELCVVFPGVSHENSCIVLVRDDICVIFIVFEKCHGTGKFITRQPRLGSLPHRNPAVKCSGSSAGQQSNCCMINGVVCHVPGTKWIVCVAHFI